MVFWLVDTKSPKRRYAWDTFGTFFVEKAYLCTNFSIANTLRHVREGRKCISCTNKVAHLFCSCLLRVVVVKCHVILKHPKYESPHNTTGGIFGGFRGSQIQMSRDAIKLLDRLAPNLVHVPADSSGNGHS